jgi:hypothetical protein
MYVASSNSCACVCVYIFDTNMPCNLAYRMTTNGRLQLATTYLREETIPKFVRETLVWQIVEAKSKGQLNNFRIAEALHFKGVCALLTRAHTLHHAAAGMFCDCARSSVHY